jgi:hypothetical protein
MHAATGTNCLAPSCCTQAHTYPVLLWLHTCEGIYEQNLVRVCRAACLVPDCCLHMGCADEAINFNRCRYITDNFSNTQQCSSQQNDALLFAVLSSTGPALLQ